MSRKTLIIIISIIFLLVVGGLVGYYFYLTNTKVDKTEQGVGGTGSLSATGDGFTASSTIQATTTPGVIPRLRQITQTPVAGYDFVDTATGTVIWYVDRSNGNVMQTATNTLDTIRITNTTIPKVYEAYIGKGGVNVILRTLNETSDSIQTFIGTVKKKSATSTDNVKDLVGTFTADTLAFTSLSPSKTSFFGMTNGLGNVYQMTGKSSTVFSSPLKRWIPQWINDSTILMTSSPSARTQNLAYLLNINTKAFTKILGPKNGLVASASSDASRVLFSENKGDVLKFGAFDVKTGTETELNKQTIPDKCVWSKKDTSVAYCGFPKSIPNALFPDDWYKGKVFFNDTLGSINIKTLQTDNYSDMEKESGVAIDATNLILSKDESYILFTNKRDLTLWVLQL